MKSTKQTLAFTDDRVRRVVPPQRGRDTYYDEKQPCLILMVSASGSKIYYLYKRIGGTPQRLRLGQAGEITVDTARQLVRSKLNNLAADRLGLGDPAAGGRITLEQLFRYFLEHHAKPHKKTWRQDEYRHKKYIPADWKSRDISKISRPEVVAFLAMLGKKHGPYVSNRVQELLTMLFNTAINDMNFAGNNPAARVKRFTETARERFLRAEEVPVFFQMVAEMRAHNAAYADAVEMLLWTGARKSNVFGMRWSEVSLARKEWVIPAWHYKSKRTTTIHLVDQAIEILTRRNAARAADCDRVFPAKRKAGAHLDDSGQAARTWRRIRRKHGLVDLHLHDLRRTVGSWAAGMGASLPLIGKLLGHVSPAATAVYARLDVDPIRQAASKVASALDAARGQPTELDVVRIEPVARRGKTVTRREKQLPQPELEER